MFVKDAIILAAGKGSRMKKKNQTLIKPLIEVNGKILIGYVIEALANAKIENIHIIASVYEDISIIKEIYPTINFKFYYHDNDNTALVALKLVEKSIENNFILADCDIVCDIDKLTNTIASNEQRLKVIDGLVACATNPKFTNNYYLKVKDNRVIGFDKKGNPSNLHGGFIYVFNKKFYKYLNQHFYEKDMAFILDGYFSENQVYPMYIDDIWDIDEEEEIGETVKLLKKDY